ncbi:MAG: hypothetical protein U0930_17280 [Pirellulales bacterium]
MHKNPKADKEEELIIDPEDTVATVDESEQPVGTGRVLFSIRDMLILTTVTAVIVVIAPSMKYLVEGISVIAWITAFWSMLIVVMLIARYRGTVRQNVLSRAGNLWARGTVRDLEWQQRLHTVVWLQLVFGLLLLLSMSIWVGLAFGEQQGRNKWAFVMPMFLPVIVVLHMTLMAIWFLSSAFFSLVWKSYPGEVEFYEKGVSIQGHRFYAWDQIEQMLPSEGYRSAIALTVRYFSRFGKTDGQPFTLIVRLPKAEVQSVLERYQSNHAQQISPVSPNRDCTEN